MSNFRENGFTLIELTVALGIFLVIISVVISVFISVLQQQKRILAGQELLSQAGFALEYISTALRQATPDNDGICLGQVQNVYVLTHCSISQACSGIKFINLLENNACQEIFLDNTNSKNPTLRQIKNGAPAQLLLSDDFMIKYVTFIIDGDMMRKVANVADSFQPRVTLLLDVLTGSPANQQEKIIQTTVSQRNYK